MIVGAVNDALEATLTLTVLNYEERSQRIEVVVDTGFNGSLTLPRSIIEAMELPWLARQHGKLADGEIHPFDVFTAKVEWGGEFLEVEVEAAEIEPLLGMSLLKEQRLTVDVVDSGRVTIEKLV